MSDALERKIEENTNVMKEMLRKMGGSVPTFGDRSPTNDGSSKLSSDATRQFLSTLTGGVTDFTGKLVRNQADITDVTNFTTDALKHLGLPAELLGTALKGITGYAVEAVNDWKQFSDLGISTYGSAMYLQNAIMKTGLNTREFGEVFSIVGDQVLKFKGTMSGGIDGLSYVINQFNEPTRLANFARMGMDQKVANEVLGTVIRGASTYQLATKEGQEQIIKTSEVFAKEIDATAKVTGMSRKAMLENIKGATDDYRARAAMLLLEKTNPAASAGLADILRNGAKDVGPMMKDYLVQMVASGGVTGGTNQSQINAMLPETAQLVRDIARLNQGTAEERKQAEILSKRITETAANELKGNESTLRQAIIGNPQFAPILQELLGGTVYNRVIGQNAAAMQGQGTPGAKATLEQEGFDANGIAVKGQETTKLVMNINQRLREWGTEAVKAINDTNNELDKHLKELNTSANLIRGYNNDGTRFAPNLIEKIKTEFFGGKDPKQFWSELASERDNRTRAAGGPNAEVNATSADGSRNFGTEKVTGQRKEPKTARLIIHRNENVLEPNEAAWYDSMGGMTGIQTMIDQLSSASGSLGVSPTAGSSVLPMMSSILKGIPSQLSTAMQNAQPTVPTTTDAPAIDQAFLEKFLETLTELNKTSADTLAIQAMIANNTDKAARNTKNMSSNIY